MATKTKTTPPATLEEALRRLAPDDGAPPAEQARRKMILLHMLLVVQEAGEVPELHREPVEAYLENPCDATAQAATAHIQKHGIERRSNQEKGALYGCLAVGALTASSCAGYVLGAAQAAARHLAGRDQAADAEERVLALVQAALVSAEREAARAARKPAPAPKAEGKAEPSKAPEPPAPKAEDPPATKAPKAPAPKAEGK